jgi:hypothetical protein
LEGPSSDYPLGTDQFGRDVYSRVVQGARISMLVGLASSLVAVVVATVFGLLLGYFGGVADLIGQRVVDAVQAFPWLFLIITVMSLLGPGIPQVIIVLGVPWGIVNIRTVRSVVLSVKETPYVRPQVTAAAADVLTLHERAGCPICSMWRNSCRPAGRCGSRRASAGRDPRPCPALVCLVPLTKPVPKATVQGAIRLLSLVRLSELGGRAR